jgi:HSP20 family protein
MVEIAIPGYEKEDFQLEIRHSGLFLTVNKNDRILSYSVWDSSYASTHDLDSAKATYKNGILSIEIPRTKARIRKIEVN